MTRSARTTMMEIEEINRSDASLGDPGKYGCASVGVYPDRENLPDSGRRRDSWKENRMAEAKLGGTQQLPGLCLKYPLSICLNNYPRNKLNYDKIGLSCILSDAISPGISGKAEDASPDCRNLPDSGRLSKEQQTLVADDGRTSQLPDHRRRHDMWYPYHYRRHVARAGAKCINPEKIPEKEVYINSSTDFEFGDPEPRTDEEGLPSLAFIFGENEIMLTVNHSEPGFLPNFIILDDHLIATITTKDADVLKDLKNKCLQWESVNVRKVDVATVAQLMADILSSHCEGRQQLVALVAGFDYIKGPELYRVDHNGVLIKGKNKLAAGSGIDGAYWFLNPYHITIPIRRNPVPGNIYPHSNFPYEDKHQDMSVWSVDEAAWWAKRAACIIACGATDGADFVTVYYMGAGPKGVKKVFADLNVEAFKRESKLRYSAMDREEQSYHQSRKEQRNHQRKRAF